MLIGIELRNFKKEGAIYGILLLLFTVFGIMLTSGRCESIYAI